MIVSFGDRTTSDLFHGLPTARARKLTKDLLVKTLRKLDMLNSATSLRDVRSPPGNRLESLKGDMRAFHSIRVNDQWRIVFRWSGRDAHEVRLVDYH